MILINLLPHREEKRKLRKQAFFAGLGLSALAGLVLLMLWYGLIQQQISAQQARNDKLAQAILALDEQIKSVATLKEEIDALKARQRAVENLQTDRNMPVHLLNELVRQTPEGIVLKSIRQEGADVLIAGQAQSNERVSELLRNTANNSPWLERPELVEIKASADTGGDKKVTQKLFDFSVRVVLKRPGEAAESASAASAPRKAGV
ncbi:fimbrial assembly protein [Aquabacterium lacunae]|jgi:type IV pilus assembly protein PilN|uniref:Fimbrial assembly protein n=1 Tax=Aquabacterium lacunae TaxID=2528630 RepID=A0A4Q9H261_9BURK|nr:PilN domain-containing protein [Aquabacterium lacunae]TBO34293.1 fimbrial assembly protein [Aquabacterium lacunae]